ncbi:uncharacterized protein LOC135367637 isoform X2 [Ornithodoros turicata]|uniref:uncharacterized protein LOC135367637 isoform X2 n=1 Tax=Ornithodoros turicata TaxID=34597 RepID=UPI0031387F46
MSQPSDQLGETEFQSVYRVESNDTCDDDRSYHVFPDFGALRAVIISDQPITHVLHRRITDVLFQSMMSLSITPSRRFYSKVVGQLLMRCPRLADVVGTGEAPTFSVGEDPESLRVHEE